MVAHVVGGGAASLQYVLTAVTKKTAVFSDSYFGYDVILDFCFTPAFIPPNRKGKQNDRNSECILSQERKYNHTRKLMIFVFFIEKVFVRYI